MADWTLFQSSPRNLLGEAKPLGYLGARSKADTPSFCFRRYLFSLRVIVSVGFVVEGREWDGVTSRNKGLVVDGVGSRWGWKERVGMVLVTEGRGWDGFGSRKKTEDYLRF